MQASVTGMEPKKSYILALSNHRKGEGALEPLSTFTTNPAGSAIVNAIGPIRQIVQGAGKNEQRYLVIAEGAAVEPDAVVQLQVTN